MRNVVVACAALCVATFSAHAEELITYSKYFKGSTPERVIIIVPKNGNCTYKESVDDDQPIKFQLPEAQVTEIYSLAEKLGKFNHPLESGLKVANMGEKSFRFEDGAVHNEVKFNYSLDTDAQALQDWFERISETEQHYINLNRTARFDKLGVNDVLLQLQVTYDRKRLMAPEQFLPLLDRVSKNEAYLHIARERAAMLAEVIRNKPTAAAQTATPKAVQQ